jgi:hypothetical protein
MTNSMNNSATYDRWLLPTRQAEYPGRAILPDTIVHGRREATFLVLAAMFFVAMTALLVLGASRVIDGSALIARVAPNIELPFALLVPLAVVPFALSFIAGSMTYDLFGRRRATALIWTGLAGSMIVVGVMYAADVLDGGAAFEVSSGLATCFIVAHAVNLLACAALHRLGFFSRTTLASVFAQAAGWGAAGLVLRAVDTGILTEAQITPLVSGAALASMLCVLVLAIPAALVNRALAVALRVGDYDEEPEAIDLYADDPAPMRPAFAEGSVARKLPKAVIIDEDDAVQHQPFSSAEMRFFTEGDAVQE